MKVSFIGEVRVWEGGYYWVLEYILTLPMQQRESERRDTHFQKEKLWVSAPIFCTIQSSLVEIVPCGTIFFFNFFFLLIKEIPYHSPLALSEMPFFIILFFVA